MMTRTSARYLVAFCLFVLIGFFVRAVSLDAQSLWRDEVDALRFATAPAAEMLSNFTRPGWNGPLYYVLLRGWIALAGASEYALRFFSLLFGIACIPLAYVLGRRLFGSPVGIFSAVLVTTSPYLVWYSQEVKMYTLVMALALLAIYSLRRAVEGGGWLWWAIQIVATTLAFYSHILAALLIPVQGLLYAVWWPQSRKRWRGALVSAACLTLPYLPLAVWQAPLALQARETGFYSYSLTEMVVILLNGWSTGILGDASPWMAALMGVLAVGGLLSSDAFASLFSDSADEETLRTSLRDYLVLLLWLSVPLLSIWLISLRQPLFTDRYLIWSAPAFYLLVALALASFATTEHWARWVVVPLLGAILISNGVNLWEQATTPIKADFRAAAAYVANYADGTTAEGPDRSETESEHSVYLPTVGASPSRFDELIIFQIPYGRYTFDYYFPVEEYPRADGLYTNHRTVTGDYAMSQEQAAQQMRAMTRGRDAAWLVASEVSMWDERRLVQQWLDQHGQRVTEAHFNRVDVYRYQLTDP